MAARSGKIRDWAEIRAFRGLLRAHARAQELHRVALAKIGLTITELDLLLALGNSEGKRMSDLATAMITSPGNVTRLCTALEERGLVRRTRSATSDREVIASLTAAGQRRFEEIFQPVATFTADMMGSALDEEELRQLGDLLEKLQRATAPAEIRVKK